MEYIQQKLLPTEILFFPRTTIEWNNLEQDSAIAARQPKDTNLSLPLEHRVLPPPPLKIGSRRRTYGPCYIIMACQLRASLSLSRSLSLMSVYYYYYYGLLFKF